MSCRSSCAPGRAAPSSSARRASSSAAEQAEDQPQLIPEPAVWSDDGFEFDVERIVARQQGREGWTREGRRQLEQPPLGAAGSCSPRA